MANPRKISIMLDDDPIRPTPNGFERFYSGEALLEYLADKEPRIKRITFDNDLGTDRLEGYQVFDIMLEENWQVESINVHSQNIVAVPRMLQALKSAQRHGFFDQNVKATSMHLPAYMASLKR